MRYGDVDSVADGVSGVETADSRGDAMPVGLTGTRVWLSTNVMMRTSIPMSRASASTLGLAHMVMAMAETIGTPMAGEE